MGQATRHAALPVRSWRTIVQYSSYIFVALWGVSAPAQDTTPLTPDTEYVRGVKAFAEGDYKTAAELWLADAYLGSADAQFNIGVLYVEGKGLPKDRTEAVFWFTKAASQGNREAQYNLGHLLLEESDDIDKIRQGIEWWRKSAEAGFPVAQYNYGRALFHGIGTDEDRPGSRQWFERAANGGNEKAAEFLAVNSGLFVEASPPIEITEPPAIRSSEPNLEIASKPTTALINSSEYVLVNDSPILVYARFNTFSPIVTRADARMLFRVVKRSKGWILGELPGGLPGWVRNEGIRIEKGLVEVVAASVSVHADPTESEESNDIGELLKDSKAILLEQQPGWTRVQLPEKIPGWIEEAGVRAVVARAEEIAQGWQNQRVKQRLAVLASREVKVAAAPGQPEPESEKIETAEEDSVEQGGTLLDIELLAAPPVEDVRDTLQQTIVVASRESAAPSTAEMPVTPAGTGVVRFTADTGTAVGDESEEGETPRKEEQTRGPSTVLTTTSTDSQAVRTDAEQPVPGQETVSTIRRTNRQDVAVRTGATHDAALMITLPKNTLVDILDRRTGFARVSLPGGIPVWIEASSARERDDDVVVELNRARARSRAGVSQPVVGLLPQGSTLGVLERREDWLRVVAPEWITGWVPEAALEAPPLSNGLDQIWQQQAQSLVEGYLGDSVAELASAPRVLDESLITTGIRNDNRWLFEQSAKKYTLQLFSMQNRQSAEARLTTLNRRGQFYSTVVKGDRWYYILLGKFLTAEAAEAMAATLPRWADGSRVRSLARLQVNRCKKIDQFNEDESRGLEELCR